MRAPDTPDPLEMARQAFAEAQRWEQSCGPRSITADDWFKAAMALYALAAYDRAHTSRHWGDLRGWGG